MEMGEKFRSNSFYIVQSAEICWKCNRVTQVVAFLLPAAHERFEYIYDEDEAMNVGEWFSRSFCCFLNYVYFLNKDLLKSIQKISSNYYYDFSNTTNDKYYMNHCEHCRAKQGDFFLFSEPGGSFCPLSPKEAEIMKLYLVESLFEAKAGGYSSVEFLDDIQDRCELTIEDTFLYPESKNTEQFIMQDQPIYSKNECNLRGAISVFKIIVLKVKGVFYKAFLFLVRNNWRMSKNGNLYNPIIGATVYQKGLEWNIARYGAYYRDFPSQKEAMNTAFTMWLEERIDLTHTNPG